MTRIARNTKTETLFSINENIVIRFSKIDKNIFCDFVTPIAELVNQKILTHFSDEKYLSQFNQATDYTKEDGSRISGYFTNTFSFDISVTREAITLLVYRNNGDDTTDLIHELIFDDQAGYDAETLFNYKFIEAKDLVPGIMIDPAGDKYADPNNDHIEYETEYASIMEIKHEDEKTVVIYTDSGAVAYPANHVLKAPIEQFEEKKLYDALSSEIPNQKYLAQISATLKSIAFLLNSGEKINQDSFSQFDKGVLLEASEFIEKQGIIPTLIHSAYKELPENRSEETKNLLIDLNGI